MAELAQQEIKEGRMPEQGRVKNVANQWRVFEDSAIANQLQNAEFKDKWAVYEDGAMAHVMQQEEFEHKYGMNRYHRRTVRDDIPVARIVQSAEEEKRQREEMIRLEQQKLIADEDELIARQMADNLRLQADAESMQRHIADEEQTLQLLAEEDDTLRNDEELARQLQEREKQKFERKRLERERRKLEQQIANERHEAERRLAHYRKELPSTTPDNQHNVAVESLQNGASSPDRLLRVDGKVEDLGDFTDFYNIPDSQDEASKKVMQQLQDEELAHLLQEQEHKRGSQVNTDARKAIEVQDAELARVMQEQEKLKERKRKQKRLAQRQASERQRQSSGSDHTSIGSYQRSRSADDYSMSGSNNLHPAHRGVDQNQYTGGSTSGSTGGSAQFSSRLGDPNQMRDPRDEDLYEQPWTSIPRMQAPPLPNHPPPALSSHDVHHRLHPQEEHHNYVAHNHARQSSRDSYDSQDSGAGSPMSPTYPDTNMEGPTAYKPMTSSPSNNLFMDLDPTIQRPDPEPMPQPIPDADLSAQRMPEEEPEPEPVRPTKKEKYSYDTVHLEAGTPDEQYAEVGDFAPPVSGQRRPIPNKKGKEKKAPGKNKNGSCKQQ